MKKRMILMVLAVVVVMGLVFGFKSFQSIMTAKFIGKIVDAPQTVASAKAHYEEWQPTLKAVGSFRAVNGANLSAEVGGIVQAIAFKDGSDVAAGDVVLQLRADDDIARLHALEATMNFAEITLRRDQSQLKSGAVSQATLDADRASLENAKAQVEQQNALIDKKTIRAPFAGRIGIRLVDVGQYLVPGATIVSLQSLDEIYADFMLPEQDIPKIAVGQKVGVAVDAYPDTPFGGSIAYINSGVAESTRNIFVRVRLPNPDHKLLPGMFGRLSIETGKPQKHLTLPQTAITYNPYGDTVYVVDRTNPARIVAKQVFVTLGTTRGDQVAVLSGIKDGDEVVTVGQLKIRNGAVIAINNEIQPLDDAHPTPMEQ